MPYTSNVCTFQSRSPTDASGTPGNATGTGAQLSPNILTYRYNSQMMYVATGKNYDQAVDFAVESFQELREVARDRICLDVRVYGNRDPMTVGVGPSAWSLLVDTFTRFHMVDVRVGPPGPPKSAMTPQAFVSPVHDGDAFASETGSGWYPTSKANLNGPQTNLVMYGALVPSYSSSLSQTQFVVDHVVSARAEHRTVHSIRPYVCGANTVTGTPVTVTVQWPEKS